MRILQIILSAISMPIDLDRSNHLIVKRIIGKWSLNGNKEMTLLVRGEKNLAMAVFE
jgi:hypothetical protein